ncbi:hypothetical protein MHBO_003433 [Bonamia ostreae]|uniref:Uncharacterized protein n=1 Tax=Bonamia ostreae TaxID=126728 RepID=A0ABV2AQF0_9EUKA
MASQKVFMCLLEDKVNDFMQELDSNVTSFTQYKSKSFLVKPTKDNSKSFVVKPEPQNSKDFSKVDFRENKSSRSKKSSHQSHASSHHPSLAQQRLEAEEAKAKLEDAQKEAKLKKEQASIQVDFEVQRDAAVAESKLRALESMQDCISVSSQSIVEPVVDIEDPMERTRKFSEEINQQQTECITRKPLMESTHLQRPLTSAYDKEPTQISDQQHETTVTPNAKLYTPPRALNPLATEFEPNNNVFDITSFLLKKELIINKLVNLMTNQKVSWHGKLFSNQ